MKKFFILLTALLLVLGVVGSAVGQSWEERYDRGRVLAQRAIDAEICLVAWHDGSATEAGTAVTSAWFSSTTDVDILCYINGALDTRISTDGIIDVTDGAENTFGEVADLINSAQGWHCQLVDALRADATTNVNSITNVKDSVCYQNSGVTLGRDCSDGLAFSVGLVNYGHGNEDIGGDQVFLDAFVIDAVFNDGTNYIQVYDCDDVAKTETAILRTEAAATTVEFWYPTYGPNGKPILALDPGHRVVVKSVCSAATNPDALSVIGAIGSIVKVH